MPRRGSRIGRTVVTLAGLALAAAVGWAAFVVLPTTLADVVGLLLAVGVAAVGLRSADRLAERLFPSYNVVEVAVEGPITRDGGGRLPARPGGASADDVVDLIERADADRHARALLVKLNTPGGEVVPSDDIRRAAAAFDGPTVAYATDQCASGGYWIASACDALWAREGSLVGSIGVRSGLLTATGLADRLGVDYEGFSRGKYKDAGQPLSELTEDERVYLQGLVDGFYDQFVERVADGRGVEEAAVRDTESRVYLGEAAVERGLVDRLGAREDVESALEAELGEPVAVRELTPQRHLAERLRGTAQRLAYAVGAGAAGAVAGDPELAIELR